MEIKFIYPQWGSAHIKLPTFLKKIKEAGYSGVELGLPLEKRKRDEIVSIIKDFKLDVIAQHYHTEDSDFELHKKSFEKHLYNMAESEPLLINSHTGKDFFSFSENGELLELGQKIQEETGVLITHETHRSRFSFAAHVCSQYLREYPFLNLTADFSHWCNVAESLLENQVDAVELAIEHTAHIHARVGSSQSAQVIDPREELYKNELKHFKAWWRKMILSPQKRGLKELTIVPEYGPYPYSLYRPRTTEPFVDQWEINQFIKDEILRDC